MARRPCESAGAQSNRCTKHVRNDTQKSVYLPRSCKSLGTEHTRVGFHARVCANVSGQSATHSASQHAHFHMKRQLTSSPQTALDNAHTRRACRPCAFECASSNRCTQYAMSTQSRHHMQDCTYLEVVNRFVQYSHM